MSHQEMAEDLGGNMGLGSEPSRSRWSRKFSEVEGGDAEAKQSARVAMLEDIDVER